MSDIAGWYDAGQEDLLKWLQETIEQMRNSGLYDDFTLDELEQRIV